jgi:hypothetical protein
MRGLQALPIPQPAPPPLENPLKKKKKPKKDDKPKEIELVAYRGIRWPYRDMIEKSYKAVRSH